MAVLPYSGDDDKSDSLVQRAVNVVVAPLRLLTSRTAVKAYLSTILFLTTSTLLITVSSAAYALFYYRYIPQINLERTLYLQYGSGAHPYATTALDTSALVSQQAYDVELVLHMPRTPNNIEAGNFMLDLALLGPGIDPKTLPETITSWLANITSDNVLYRSRRPAILPYSSPILSLSHTFLHLPWHLLNLRDLDSARLVVPMFDMLSFPRGSRYIPTHARLELQASTVLQVYEVKLVFRARFQGLRYLIYNYRITAFLLFSAAFYTVSVATMALVWAVISALISSSSEPSERKALKQESDDADGRAKAEPEYGRPVKIKREDEAGSPTGGLSLSNVQSSPVDGEQYSNLPGRSSAVEPGEEDVDDYTLTQPIGPGEAADDEDELEEAEEFRGRSFEGDSGIGTSMESEHTASGLFRRRSSRALGHTSI